MITFYRGDARAPNDIKAAGGFDLWDEAKGLVAQAGGIDNWIFQKMFQLMNKMDVKRYIITGKSHARPTISTSRDQGCGGYSSGYIYRIEYANTDLTVYPFTSAVMPVGTTPCSKTTLGGMGSAAAPTLLLSHATLSLSVNGTIATDLLVSTQEVAFFTAIPLARITAYKQGSGAFQPMP